MDAQAPLDCQDILIESIVAITEQRDQHSLELSLCASLHEALQASVLTIIEISAGGGTYVPSRQELPEAVLNAARALQTDEFDSLSSAELTYMLACLEGSSGRNMRVLVIGMDGWDEVQERLLVGMVRVFQNFTRLMRDSERDTLTGLNNRRKLEKHLANLLSAQLAGRRRNKDEGQDFLAVLDLDKFKRINDTYGHLIGDEVLLTFANLLRESLREVDRSYRYGGEEFIVVLNQVTDAQAAMVLERLRKRVAEHDFPQVGQVTVSIGYTQIANQDLPPRIIEEADKALYYAKEHGRNQVRDYRALAEAKAVDTSQAQGSVELF